MRQMGNSSQYLKTTRTGKAYKLYELEIYLGALKS